MSKGIRGARALALVARALTNSKRLPHQRSLTKDILLWGNDAVLDVTEGAGKTLSALHARRYHLEAVKSMGINIADTGEPELTYEFTPEPTVHHIDMSGIVKDVRISATINIPDSYASMSKEDKDFFNGIH